jgi:hypothetical protein
MYVKPCREQCACHTHAACTLRKCHKHAACAPHACLCRVHARLTHTTSHVIHTLHACGIHPAQTKHAIHMSQTCLMHAALHTCHSLAICRLNTFSLHIFMHAQTYYMQERHKLAAHTLYAHTMYDFHGNNTQAAHMPHSPSSQMPHMLHAQVCCRHAKDTDHVHVACML